MTKPWKLCLILVSVMGISPQCKDFTGKMRTPAASSTADEIIFRESVSFTRTADGIGGTLLFKAKTAVACEIQFWTEDLLIPPTPSAPYKTKCKESAPKDLVYRISFDNLKPTERYIFRVMMWLPHLNRNSFKSLQIEESGAPGSNFAVITRLNVRQANSEISVFKFATPPNRESIEQLLFRSPRCSRNQIRPKNPFIPIETMLPLTALSSSGFATSNASLHPFHNNLLTMRYELIQSSQNWNWAFKWNNSDLELLTPPPSFLANIRIDSTPEIPIRYRDLRAQITPETTTFESGIPLAWSPRNKAQISYVYTKLIAKKTGHSVSCIFQGNLGQGVIESKLISKFPKGEYRLTILYQSSQIHFRRKENFPPWIIVANDWRYLELQNR